MASAAPPLSLTTFVGRLPEVTILTDLITRHRLVTVTGPGGIGKTRLAEQVARRIGDGTFPAGLFWVACGQIADPALVVPTAMAALGLPGRNTPAPAEWVADQLGERRLLIVLDDCDQIAEAAAAFATVLLARCPGVQLLTTSRVRLGVPGEVPWRVPPMAVSDAVALFTARAQAEVGLPVTRPSAPGDGVDPRHGGPAGRDLDEAAAAEICGRLDGLPLAIELAASRTRLLTLPEVARGLDDLLRLLSGGSRYGTARHRTIRVCIDWSVSQLDELARVLLRRLAVFTGGVRIATVEQVRGFGPLRDRAALRGATQAGDRPGRARCLGLVATGRTFVQPTSALPLVAEALKIARVEGNQPILAAALTQGLWAHLSMSDFDQAQARLEELSGPGERLGQMFRAYASAGRGLIAVARGDFPAATQAARQVFAEDLGDLIPRMYGDVIVALTAAAAGKWEEAISRLDARTASLIGAGLRVAPAETMARAAELRAAAGLGDELDPMVSWPRGDPQDVQATPLQRSRALLARARARLAAATPDVSSASSACSASSASSASNGSGLGLSVPDEAAVRADLAAAREIARRNEDRWQLATADELEGRLLRAHRRHCRRARAPSRRPRLPGRPPAAAGGGDLVGGGCRGGGRPRPAPARRRAAGGGPPSARRPRLRAAAGVPDRGRRRPRDLPPVDQRAGVRRRLGRGIRAGPGRRGHDRRALPRAARPAGARLGRADPGRAGGLRGGGPRPVERRSRTRPVHVAEHREDPSRPRVRQAGRVPSRRTGGPGPAGRRRSRGGMSRVVCPSHRWWRRVRGGLWPCGRSDSRSATRRAAERESEPYLPHVTGFPGPRCRLSPRRAPGNRVGCSASLWGRSTS